MKVALLRPPHPDSLPSARSAGKEVTEDLGLGALYTAMAAGDEFVFDVVKAIVPASLTDVAGIGYRQQVLADCFGNPEVVRRLYDIATAATQIRRWTPARGGKPRSKLRFSLEPLALLIGHLRTLKSTSGGEYANGFHSAGFRHLFATLADQLGNDYLDTLERHIAALDFPDGVHISARLGLGNKSTDFVLHAPPPPARRRGFGLHRGNGRTFTALNEFHVGVDDISELTGRGMRVAADVVSEAADYVQDFFRNLRTELGFYIGCLNLRELFTARGVPICFPISRPVADGAVLRCRDLRDVGLCVSTASPVVGNDVDGDGASLIVVTGANNGGKSTFLRSLGAAQLMMQAGMFVAAASFEADIRVGVHTNFPQDEDRSMIRGRLEQELARMAEITRLIKRNALLLCNEPFASTNERDGSQLARPIIEALLDVGVKVVLVTHLYDLVDERHRRGSSGDLFLQAERLPSGTRTFRIVAGEPEPTSHGEDIFRHIFGERVR